MSKKEFNPSAWMNNKTQFSDKDNIANTVTSIPSKNDEIELLINKIENAKLDITTNYDDWRDIGFAFSDEFKESGREYFHRISKFYHNYNQKECDEQYTYCLKSNGSGITIKTFYYKCKQAGIVFNKEDFEDFEETKEEENTLVNVPLIPDAIFPQLPQFLHNVVNVASSKEERDILLLGSIVTLSACFPKIFGIYDNKKVFSNLYLFITAQASAGKGCLVYCKQLVQPIHKYKREQSKQLRKKYEDELKAYNLQKGKDNKLIKPIPPPEKMLFIPANNSATGAFQLLNDNDGKGLIFETEGDTLSQAFKTDYGNYSDGFRKGSHHETISYYRRTDREFVEIESPCISCLLSGTPKQISALIPNAENGLFSRFIFYYINITPTWKNVFNKKHENGLEDYFNDLGTEFYQLYQQLNEQSVQFTLKEEQEEQFNRIFGELQNIYTSIQDKDYIASIRRLGLTAFRIAMIFTSLRILEHGETSKILYCSDDDFNSVIVIIKTLVKHSSQVYNDLPKNEPLLKRKNQKELFFEKLGIKFNRQDYLSIAKTLNITDKTAQRYISNFVKANLIFRYKQDCYEKNIIS